MPSSAPGLERIRYNLGSVGRTGFDLDFDLRHFSHQVIHQESRQHGFYEKETSILMSALLKEGDLVIDVGAHIGYFSLLASRLVGNTGRVFAFEPIKDNLTRLRHNIAINEVSNVVVVPKASGDYVGLASFYYTRDNDGGHALWDVGKHPFNVQSKKDPLTLEVPITTLEHYFKDVDLAALKMIKIDAEGNELNVLKGAQNILQQYRIKCISWEQNDFALAQMGHSENELRSYMQDLGYQTVAFFDQKLQIIEPCHHLKADFVFNLYFMPAEFVEAVNT